MSEEDCPDPNDPESYEGCCATSEWAFVCLDHASETEKPFCYDALDYKTGESDSECVETPEGLFDLVSDRFGVDQGDFKRSP